MASNQLTPYVLKNVHGLDTGERKGSGVYGVVCKVTVDGVPCIAKRLHDILVSPDVPRKQRAYIKKKFHDECVLLSQLSHPNIVHFVGVENWRVWHSGNNIYLSLRTTWSLPLLYIPIYIIKHYCGDGFDCFSINRNTTITSLHFIFSNLSAFSSPNKRPQQFNKSIYGSGS